MTAPQPAPGYVPNDAFTQADWDAVSDNPELTDAELARLRPAEEVLPPAFFTGLANRGGCPGAPIRPAPKRPRSEPSA